MKKIIKTALLATTLTSLLTAGTIFDLSAQHFSNSLDGDGVGGRYDLPKCYVSTALKYTNGVYALTTYRATQTMAVEIKTPPSTWSVSFDMSYYLYTDTHQVRLTSDTGKSIIVAFRWNQIYLNGKVVYEDSSALELRTLVSCTISKSGNTVTLITGLTTKTITVSGFSKLKFVNVSVMYDETTYHGSGYDYLNGLNISSGS